MKTRGPDVRIRQIACLVVGLSLRATAHRGL